MTISITGMVSCPENMQLKVDRIWRSGEQSMSIYRNGDIVTLSLWNELDLHLSELETTEED